MAKKFKRYLAWNYSEDHKNKKFQNENVWFIDKEVPNTPYYELEIKVIKFEPNYNTNRPTPPYIIRLWRAFKGFFREGVLAFKNKYKTG